MLLKPVVLGAIGLIGMTLAGSAQAQYPIYPYPYGYPPAPPPASWSYDPYTSGGSLCVQWRPGDPDSCRNQRQPSYGQPYSPYR
ncbi:MAG TPA: hypothetical protein VND87_05510 [Stellaceae bacterium]|nr:hypothetical protein [Stellaceae bacterium]